MKVFLRDPLTKRFKGFFAGTANWALPVVGKILEFCPLCNLSLFISLVGIINITTIYRLTLIHVLWFCHVRLLFQFGLLRAHVKIGAAPFFVKFGIKKNLENCQVIEHNAYVHSVSLYGFWSSSAYI